MISFISKKGADVEEIINDVNNFANGDIGAFSSTCDAAVKRIDEVSDNSLLVRLNNSYTFDLNVPLPNTNIFYRFVAKVIRKLIRWYVKGVAVQQEEFNAHTVQYLNYNQREIDEIKEQLEIIKTMLNKEQQ